MGGKGKRSKGKSDRSAVDEIEVARRKLIKRVVQEHKAAQIPGSDGAVRPSLSLIARYMQHEHVVSYLFV
jgi:hypothetical protein